MESLNPGVLLLLLLQDRDRDRGTSSSPVGAFPRHSLLRAPPAVLQITGIVPAIAGPDLCPDEGFYIKLSDASHSTLVSLPTDLNDLILADRLQIGQLIHVLCLEPGSPHPVLREFRILTGRHPCRRDTVDLVPAFPSPSFLPHSSASNSGSFRASHTPPRPPPGKKRLTHSRSCAAMLGGGTWPSSFAAAQVNRTVKKREVAGKRRSSGVMNHQQNFNFASTVEENSDSDESEFSFSTTSSSSSSSSPQSVARSRRKWGSPGRSIKEKRKETKPVAGLQRSVSASLNMLPRLARSSPKDYAPRRQNSMEKPLRLRIPVGRKLSDSEKSCSEASTISSSCSSADSTKCNAAWSLLPPNLMKHGKEALKQRDSAVQAAIDSLLEAAAAEKFIGCLSAYAELQSEKDNDPEDVIDRFLNFHRQLGQTKLIAQSSSKTSCAASGRSAAANVVAVERKSHAASWIKTALESELSQHPTQPKSIDTRGREEIALEALAAKVSSTASSKQKNALPRGSGLVPAVDALQCESNRWFLGYIDIFLDSADEMEVPALLYWLKRADWWLESISSREWKWPRERAREVVLRVEEEEMAVCERVRRKIYCVLLRHVERAASALESMSTPDGEKSIELMLAR